MLFSLLVPTHNRSLILGKLLESLGRIETVHGVELELIIVPNGCTDNTLEMIEQNRGALPFPVHCSEQEEANLNLARNRCIREAKGEILAFLDDDVWIETHWLKAAVEAYETQPADMLAGRVTLWYEAGRPPEWSSSLVERLLSKLDLGDDTIEVFTAGKVVGANFSFRRKVVEGVGGFVAGLDRAGQGLLSGGDSEFVTRSLAAGFRLFYVPKMAVRHWIPVQRTSIEYLSRLAWGRGVTRVVLAEKKRPFKWVKLLKGGLTMFLKGLMRESYNHLLGRKKQAIMGRLLRLRGSGMLAGTIQHWIYFFSPEDPKTGNDRSIGDV